MPTIDINSGKWELIKFISDNKLSIPITDGGKRRGVKALREDLEKGGYIVGVKGKSKAPKSRGKPPPAKVKVDQLSAEEQYKSLLKQFPTGFGGVKNVNVIKIAGFSSQTDVPFVPATTQEVELSGHGGIQLKKPISVNDMRDYLTSRVPADDFSGLGKAALRELYNKVKNKEEVESVKDDIPTKVADLRFALTDMGVNIEGRSKAELKQLYLENAVKADGGYIVPTKNYGKGMKVGEMRDYLSTRVPSENFKGMSKPELRAFYNKNREEEEQTKNVVMTESEEEEEPDEQEFQLQNLGFDLADDIITQEEYDIAVAKLFAVESEEEEEPVVEEPKEEFEGELVDFQGATYQYLPDNLDELYNMEGDYVGQWNVDVDDINFIHPKFRQDHEDIRDGGEEPARQQIKRRKPVEEPVREEEVEPGLQRHRDRKAAAKKHREEREKERIANIDEEDVDELLKLLDVETYGYSVAKDAWDDLKAVGIDVPEPKRTLSDMTPFEYEGIIYYIEDNDSFFVGVKTYNDKFEVVGTLKGSRSIIGEHKIRFKSKYKEIHEREAG